MDSIIRDCAKKHLLEAENRKHVEDRIIRRNYSFTYKDNLRDMLIRLVGLVKVEQIENMLDPVNFELMKSSLGTLKAERDSVTHTYLANVTQRLSAPSTIERHFQHVYDGLKDVEKCVRKLNI